MSLIESPNKPPKSPTLQPTYPGPQTNGVTGPDLKKRTHSSNAENEKLYEPVAGGPKKTS